MKIDPFFNDFLQSIRLTKNQKDDLKRGHSTLRDRLHADEDLSKIIVDTFLQGSYRRSTAIRPVGDKRADVDVIVVTDLDRNKITPQEVIDLFLPFVEKHYKGKYRIQGRSIGIELSYVDLDIVITSAPSEVDEEALHSRSVLTDLALEDFSNLYDWRLTKSWSDSDLIKGYSLSESVRKAQEWQLQPLWIPDRDAQCWVETHPLEQIRWTREKNSKTSGHYINVVKALKWFRLQKITDIKHPKGYPIEHMIGDCCPDGIQSVAEGVCKTLEKIVSEYSSYRTWQITPTLPDRGVPSHDVWKRISTSDFCTFYDHIMNYAKIAREALDETSLSKQAKKWQELFGSKFPNAPDDENKNHLSSTSGGFSERKEPTIIGGGRFA
jgi:hypothetical protein